MQRIGEDLGRSSEAQAFAWGVIVEECQLSQGVGRQGGQIGFARQPYAQTADGIFYTAFLPGCVRIAEESLDAKPIAQCVM